MHAPVITETTTTDAESAEALLASAYSEGRVRVASTGDDFVLGQRRQDFGELRVDDVRYSFHSEYDMSPLGFLLILRVVDGELALEDAGGTRRLFRGGDVFVCAKPDEGYRAAVSTRRAQAVGMDLGLLGEVSEQPVRDAVRRFTRDALPAERARLWHGTVDYVTGTLAANQAAATSPLVLGAAGRMLASATIAAFGGGAEQGHEERLGASATTVRRAVSFLEANPHLDLSVAEVAQSCHVSIRALQLAFRRHLDTTPMAYLRRVRLDRVRTDLTDAEASAGTTVSEIAARWGFADASRFSARYRRVYGETPRQTLRR